MSREIHSQMSRDMTVVVLKDRCANRSVILPLTAASVSSERGPRSRVVDLFTEAVTGGSLP
jgi:hypothetical protein